MAGETRAKKSTCEKESTGRTAGTLITLARNGFAGASLNVSNPVSLGTAQVLPLTLWASDVTQGNQAAGLRGVRV